MMLIDNLYNIGDLVFLSTDQDQKQRLVTGILIRQSQIVYYLSSGVEESVHYDFEITDVKSVLNTL
mgnify:CR=1 FL=1|jgi:hypothetical protein